MYLDLFLQPDVARSTPEQGAIRSIRFKRTCWLAQHARIRPVRTYPCDTFQLDFVRKGGALDLGTANWLTVASVDVHGYFRVGANASSMSYNRIQVTPVLAPD